MSNPQDNSRFEELAALDAVGLLDDASRQELHEAARAQKEVDALMLDFNETAAQLAHEAPGIVPPPNLREKILSQLPSRPRPSKIVPFHRIVPYAIAACLMAIGISQALQIMHLKKQLLTTTIDADRLRESNALMGIRLAMLEAKDPAYTSSRVVVAWDPYQHRGVVGLQGLPTAPAGHDYQLWVLDPNAPGPISAGLINGARAFATEPVSTENPGFAISLEPTGGSPSPTGPILFAVAPGS